MRHVNNGTRTTDNPSAGLISSPHQVAYKRTEAPLIQKDEKTHTIYIIVFTCGLNGPDHLLREQQRRK